MARWRDERAVQDAPPSLQAKQESEARKEGQGEGRTLVMQLPQWIAVILSAAKDLASSSCGTQDVLSAAKRIIRADLRRTKVR